MTRARQAAPEAPAGTVVGSLAGVVFGLVFIEVNRGGLPGNWPLVVRVAGGVPRSRRVSVHGCPWPAWTNPRRSCCTSAT